MMFLLFRIVLIVPVSVFSLVKAVLEGGITNWVYFIIFLLGGIGLFAPDIAWAWERSMEKDRPVL